MSSNSTIDSSPPVESFNSNDKSPDSQPNQRENEKINILPNLKIDMTSQIISKEKSLNDFFMKYPDLRPFVKFTECNTEGLEKLKFVQNLNSSHSIIKNDITTLIKEFGKEISASMRKIGHSSEPINLLKIKEAISQSIQVKNFDFDDNNDVLISRKLAFVQNKIKIKEVKDIHSHIQIFKETKDQMEKMQSIFNLKCLNYIKIQLDQEFFDINLRASKDQSIKKNLKNLELLRRLEKRLIHTIQNKPRAKWSIYSLNSKNDYKKQFQIYMESLIQEAFPTMDWEISYCEPLNSEVSLSRCLFNPYSPFQKELDLNIQTYFLEDTPANFVQKLTSFCFLFLDEYLGIRKKKVKYQSTALVIIFRAFFNRCYELNSSYFGNQKYNENIPQKSPIKQKSKSDSEAEFNINTNGNFMETLRISTDKKNSILKKIEQMKQTPTKDIPLPPSLILNRAEMSNIAAQVNKALKKFNELSQNDTNQKNEADFMPIKEYNITLDNTPIRQLFLSDPMFAMAAHSFNLSIYYPNPLDALFKINKALSLIHKGAINNQTVNTSKSLSIARANDILSGNFNLDEDKKSFQKGDLSSSSQNSDVKDDMKQLLSFDDLFSLFFGILLSADIPDLFDLASFVGKYSPKVCLSPPFEYAQANIEALVLHCINLEKEEQEQ